MRAAGGHAEPGAGGIAALVVLDLALQHQRLLHRRMRVFGNVRARRPAHEHRALRAEAAEQQVAQAGKRTGPPLAVALARPRVDHHAHLVRRVELAQLHEQDAAATFPCHSRVRAVAAACRVAHVGARRVGAVLVGEAALQHQELLAEFVPVRREARARRIPHDRGCTRDLAAVALDHPPPDAGDGRCHLRQRVGVHHLLAREVHPQADRRLAHALLPCHRKPERAMVSQPRINTAPCGTGCAQRRARRPTGACPA